MDFKEKIDNVLKAKGFKLWKLAEASGLGSTLEKAYDDNREMRDKTTEKFLQNLGIRPEWWDTGVEPIFQEEFNNEDKSTESIYRDLVESNTDYRLVPKTILDGEYRVVPVSAINTQDRLLDQLQKENERLWRLLEEYKARS